MQKLKIMIIGAGLLAMSAVETLAEKLEDNVVVVTASEDFGYDLASLKELDVMHIRAAADLGWDVPSAEVLAEALASKVPIYSVSLPEENKIVLVRDPKGFYDQAVKHKMEFIAIKPILKTEYWEFVPVFSTEKALSFKPSTTVEHASEEDMELLRIVPVSDFIRYN
jgi:hypothetical protein